MSAESRNRLSGSSNEKGLYIILIAFFLFVLVALCALVIGLGLLSTNKTRMQNIANVASIASLGSFVQNRNAQGTPAPYDTRRNAAVVRANEVINLNRNLPGMSFSLGNLGLAADSSGGRLAFGMWYPEMPDSQPCGSDPAAYPCFIENSGSSATTGANAVRVELKSQPNNPLILPFARFVGSDALNISTTALARLVQRCVVFALDASISTVMETHVSTDYRSDSYPPSCAQPACGPAAQNTLYPTPALAVTTPNPVAMFAYLTSHLNGFSVGSGFSSINPPVPPNPNPCQNSNNYQWEDFLYFCTMPPSRSGTPAAGPSDTRHFRSDYRASSSPYGQMAIDVFVGSNSITNAISNSYFGPQPLSRFFLAFNAGIRAVQQVRSQGDKAMVYVFQGDGIDSEPVKSGPTYQLAENMDMMVQLTNILNRGAIGPNGAVVSAVVTPNFVTRGWFPYAASSSSIVASTSNQAKALWDAMEALSACPDSARRVIVLASDGIMTCGFSRANPSGTPQPDPATDCVRPTISAGVYAPDYYANYVQAEQKILGPIKEELIRRGISVTTLLDSSGVDPNFINATIAPGLTPTPSSIWVNPEDASKYGFCGIPASSGACIPYFNTTPAVGNESLYNAWVAQGDCNYGAQNCSRDQFAFKFAGVPQIGSKFRRPNAVWAQLAMDTGGVICPLLDPCPSAWYSTDNPYPLLPAYRAGMSEIRCAPLNQSKAQQAINCVLAAVGIDPYQNVEEVPFTPAAN